MTCQSWRQQWICETRRSVVFGLFDIETKRTDADNIAGLRSRPQQRFDDAKTIKLFAHVGQGEGIRQVRYSDSTGRRTTQYGPRTVVVAPHFDALSLRAVDDKGVRGRR